MCPVVFHTPLPSFPQGIHCVSKQSVVETVWAWRKFITHSPVPEWGACWGRRGLWAALLRFPPPAGLSQHASLQEGRRLTPEHTVPAWMPQGTWECSLFPWEASTPSFQCYFWSPVMPGHSKMGRQPARQNFGFLYLLLSHASETPGSWPRACRENPTSSFDEMEAPEMLKLNSQSLLLIWKILWDPILKIHPKNLDLLRGLRTTAPVLGPAQGLGSWHSSLSTSKQLFHVAQAWRAEARWQEARVRQWGTRPDRLPLCSVSRPSSQSKLETSCFSIATRGEDFMHLRRKKKKRNIWEEKWWLCGDWVVWQRKKQSSAGGSQDTENCPQAVVELGKPVFTAWAAGLTPGAWNHLEAVVRQPEKTLVAHHSSGASGLWQTDRQTKKGLSRFMWLLLRDLTSFQHRV